MRRTDLPKLFVERFPLLQYLRWAGVRRIPSFSDLVAHAAEVLQPGDEALTHWEIAAEGLRAQAAVEPIPDSFWRRDPACKHVFSRLPRVREIVQQEMAFMQRIQRSPREQMERLYHEVADFLYSYVLFRHAGQRVYVLQQDFADLLLRTDLPNSPAGTMGFPANGFYLVVPPGLQLADPADGRTAEVEGLMVMVDDPAPSESATRSLYLDVTFRATAADPIGSASTIGFHFPLIPDKPISESFISHDEMDRPVRGRGLDHYSMGHLVASLCLYLESEHPDIVPVAAAPRPSLEAIRNPTKRRRAEQRLERESYIGYLNVGQQVGEAAAETSRLGRLGVALTRPVWVRGHFRMQAHGEGRTLRKRIWVAPHQKGPDYGEGLADVRPVIVRGRARPVDPDSGGAHADL